MGFNGTHNWRSYIKMKIVVTGGAGFIGSNTCENLIENGHEVICLDNFLTGKRENISHLMELDRFTLIEGDIRDINACNTAVKGADAVLHLERVYRVEGSTDAVILMSLMDLNQCSVHVAKSGGKFEYSPGALRLFGWICLLHAGLLGDQESNCE